MLRTRAPCRTLRLPLVLLASRLRPTASIAIPRVERPEASAGAERELASGIPPPSPDEQVVFVLQVPAGEQPLRMPLPASRHGRRLHPAPEANRSPGRLGEIEQGPPAALHFVIRGEMHVRSELHHLAVLSPDLPDEPLAGSGGGQDLRKLR